MRGKNFITAVTVVAGCLLLSMNSFAAEHLGTIAKVTDTVISEGDHGKIVTEITGTTDEEGLLALPLYEDAKLVSVTAAAGTLEHDLEEQETGMPRYLVARFAEAGKEVELNLVWDQEDTYKRKAAKTKGTAPGDLEVIRYDMVNTSPVTIGSYQLHFAVPEGYELAAIVGYDPEEEFDISSRDGYKFGSYHFGEIGVGQESSLSINIKKAGGHLALMMWGITFLVSAFFLYKNKGMLKEASDLAAKKEQIRQEGQVR